MRSEHRRRSLKRKIAAVYAEKVIITARSRKTVRFFFFSPPLWNLIVLYVCSFIEHDNMFVQTNVRRILYSLFRVLFWPKNIPYRRREGFANILRFDCGRFLFTRISYIVMVSPPFLLRRHRESSESTVVTWQNGTRSYTSDTQHTIAICTETNTRGRDLIFEKIAETQHANTVILFFCFFARVPAERIRRISPAHRTK